MDWIKRKAVGIEINGWIGDVYEEQVQQDNNGMAEM